MSDSTLLPEWGGSLVVGVDNIRLPTVAEQTYGQVFNTILDSSVYNYWLQQLSKKVNYSLSTGISQWNTTTNYVVDDVVTYSGDIYISKTTNSNSQPATNPSDWKDISGGTDTLNPVGSIIMVASNSVPDGYFSCDGSSISRTLYSELFAKIGTIYGVGDGSTTFNLPAFDLIGSFLRGSGGAASPLGTLQTDAIRNIFGEYHSYGISNNDSGRTAVATGPFSPGNSRSGRASGVQGTNSMGLVFNAALVVPTANENRPINYAVKICIKY